MRDNKNVLLILLILTFLLSLLTIFVVAEGGIPSVSARASALYEPSTKEFIYENNANLRLPMASTTKIMTALIAIERCDLSEVIVIPCEATGIEGSSVYLRAGDVVTIRDLLYSVLLQSANDAATALAIKIAGDVKGFADVMNARAAELGLNDTHFENPHGLDSKEHYTTAHDLALLAAYALENDTFRTICSTYKYSFVISDSIRTVVNHNKLLKRYDGAIGVKTGYTDESGRCLVSAAEKDGLTLVAVTLNAPDDWRDHTALLDYGFSRFETVKLSSIAITDFTVPVINGQRANLSASIADRDAIITVRKGQNQLHAKTLINDNLSAPISKGDVIGTVTVYDGDTLLYSFDIIADENVAKADDNGFLDFIKNIFRRSNGENQTSKIHIRRGHNVTPCRRGGNKKRQHFG